MKTVLEQEDTDAIANRIIELLRPLLPPPPKAKAEDEFFTTATLAEYLHVQPCTVYNWVHLKKVPYFKTGKYTRFKKSAIAKWLAEREVRPW